MAVFIGIDPGKSGGLAAIDCHGAVVSVVKMPDTEAAILRWLRATRPEDGGVLRAVLEYVAGGLHAGKAGRMGVTSAFTFGRNYGALRMALAASEVPYDEAAPGVWQKAMQCRSKGDKNVTKARAQQLFPAVVCTHAISDALLLAEYCRRLRSGSPAAEQETA